ncbi:MAG: hypothetical protein GY952_05100 [Rhodobacteraceae bacterium]|nr:hypothetical protein [Paracoccaceae bacterium]
MSRNLLTVILAAAVAVAVYAALSVSKFEGYPSLIATGLGVFGGFVLFLSGLIDSSTAQKGILPAVASVLPRFLGWACANRSRATGVALLAGGLAVAAFWAGPHGVTVISIACDEADQVIIDGTFGKECPAALNAGL